jgi:hypothetical protein
MSFTRVFTYQLLSSGLLDQTFAARIDPNLSGASPSRLQTEAREAGVDFGVSGPLCAHVHCSSQEVALSKSKALF